MLEKLNRPDYVLYNHFNETLWKTVYQIGFDRVKEVANEIDARSKAVKNECIAPEQVKNKNERLESQLLESKKFDPDCRAFLAHGPAMTKILQQRMIDIIGPDKYKSCKKGSAWDKSMDKHKEELRQEFSLLVPTNYRNQT